MAREHEGHIPAQVITPCSQAFDAQRGLVIGLFAFFRAIHLVMVEPNDKKNKLRFEEETSVLHLVDFLSQEYQLLRAYLGETQFVELAKFFIAAQPLQLHTARQLCNKLPKFLADYVPFQHHSEIQEMAALELALNSAFAAPDIAALRLPAFNALNSKILNSASWVVHPSASRLTFKQNTTSIWSALKCDTAPPKPFLLDEAQEILVWRQGEASRFRLLGDEEAMAFDACKTGASFGTLCKLIALKDNAQSPAVCAEAYLRGWIEAELLSAPATFAVSPMK